VRNHGQVFYICSYTNITADESARPGDPGNRYFRGMNGIICAAYRYLEPNIHFYTGRKNDSRSLCRFNIFY